MLKSILIPFFALFAFYSVQAQTKTIELSEFKAGRLHGKYNKDINVESSDTTHYIYILFPEAGYSTYTSIILHDDAELEIFLEDINMALKEVDSKTDVKWQRENYSISVKDDTKEYIVLHEADREGNDYCYIPVKNGMRLRDWLKSLQFGKD